MFLFTINPANLIGYRLQKIRMDRWVQALQEAHIEYNAEGRAQNVLSRITAYEIDWGQGWVKVDPDPTRHQPEPPAPMEPLPYPTTGERMWSQCPDGCFEIAGYYDDFQEWLGQVPRIFGETVVAARVQALKETREPQGEIITIAAARYDDSEWGRGIAKMWLSDELPLVYYAG
ncbi:MAG: hypothetical protein ACREDR_10830 [Blastocatellia bacterium]